MRVMVLSSQIEFSFYFILFIYFNKSALTLRFFFSHSHFSRVHFGMNGSMRVNPGERSGRSGSAPALEVHLTNDVVCFYDSTVESR